MTSKLGLTKEERALVAQVASAKEPRLHRLWFYSAALVPAVGFGVYGIIHTDLVALALGFAGLVLFCYWRLASEFRAAPVFDSLCSKIDAFERGDGA
ncbi:hypothetical protein [Luteimonas saliphila]|uniref:hypothetical protein n=1 Tax=Luteimonas saliphila TaxID=2804919 RepID=UPI00192D1E49|nr:hypothetical protein [Luteimonas saliphila]